MAVVTTYWTPGSTTVSGVTAPTAAQASKLNMLVCDVSLLDADTVITFTHNWGSVINASFATLFPLVQGIMCTGTTNTAGLSPFTFSWVSANVLLATKGTGGGSGGSYRFVLTRPISAVE